MCTSYSWYQHFLAGQSFENWSNFYSSLTINMMVINLHCLLETGFEDQHDASKDGSLARSGVHISWVHGYLGITFHEGIIYRSNRSICHLYVLCFPSIFLFHTNNWYEPECIHKISYLRQLCALVAGDFNANIEDFMLFLSDSVCLIQF